MSAKPRKVKIVVSLSAKAIERRDESLRREKRDRERRQLRRATVSMNLAYLEERI